MTDQLLYVEEYNEVPFDWNAFLAQDYITQNEWDYADSQARDWVTCACGNQCAVLPRNDDGEPQDRRLSELGMNFFDAICDHNVLDAREVLTEIEQRSAYLLTLDNYTAPAQ